MFVLQDGLAMQRFGLGEVKIAVKAKRGDHITIGAYAGLLYQSRLSSFWPGGRLKLL